MPCSMFLTSRFIHAGCKEDENFAAYPGRDSFYSWGYLFHYVFFFLPVYFNQTCRHVTFITLVHTLHSAEPSEAHKYFMGIWFDIWQKLFRGSSILSAIGVWWCNTLSHIEIRPYCPGNGVLLLELRNHTSSTQEKKRSGDYTKKRRKKVILDRQVSKI